MHEQKKRKRIEKKAKKKHKREKKEYKTKGKTPKKKDEPEPQKNETKKRENRKKANKGKKRKKRKIGNNIFSSLEALTLPPRQTVANLAVRCGVSLLKTILHVHKMTPLSAQIEAV